MENRDIIKIQNEDKYIDLLKAQRVAYSEAKRIHSFNVVLVVLAFFMPFAIWLFKDLDDKLTIFGGLITIVYIAVQFFERKYIETAANIQEQFDRNLYNLKWNSFMVGNKVPTDEIYNLKTDCKEKSENFLNWYSTEIKDNIPFNFKILLCQRINLSYDIDLKRKFATFLIVFTFLYYFVLFLIALYKNMTINDILLSFSSSLAFLFYSYQTVNGLLEQKHTQERLLSQIDSFLENRKTPSDEELRDIQNMIYTQRTAIEKIPDWFYRLNRNKNEIKIDELIKQKVEKLGF